MRLLIPVLAIFWVVWPSSSLLVGRHLCGLGRLGKPCLPRDNGAVIAGQDRFDER
jgi:hypothetical protein